MENTIKIEIIKKIINSNKIVGYDTDDINKTKVNYIQSFLSGWITEEDMCWIWEE